MAKDQATLRFWLRIDRANKDGSAPIHLIYQLRGNRRYYAIPDINIFPVNWDVKDQQAIYVDKKTAKKTAPELDYDLLLTSSEADKVNNELGKVKDNVEEVETRFRLDKKQFDCKAVIDRLKELKRPQTKKEDPQTSVADFIRQFANETTAHKDGTKQTYTSLANHIERFERDKKQSFTFEKVDVQLLKNLQNFLLQKFFLETKGGKRKEVQLNNVTIAKILSTLKTLLRRAEDEYDISVNPKYKKFKNPHPRRDGDLEVIALTEDELAAIYNLDLSNNKRLDEVRDIFCFSCATGLRYGDLKQLRRQHIKKDNAIRMPSSDKNGKMIDVPLTPISFAILQKYNDRYMPLPTNASGEIISNQKMNDYIKEVGELAGIDTPIEIAREYGPKKETEIFKKYELLSIHVGRKTFTTLSLEKGIPLQDVMSLTTHSSFKAVKRYINVTRERKKTVMAMAYGNLPNLLVAVK